jgi:[acyl-carrier-protein] S-malonyltransferase
MGQSLVENFKAAREAFEEAEDALSMPLKKICFEGPSEKLNQTAITQPAILCHSVAVLRVIQDELSLSPAATCGHSLGEYGALVSASSLDFADAIKVVHERGSAMQEAVPLGSGGMSVILKASREKVLQWCEAFQGHLSSGEVLEPANMNAPEQTVVAGTSQALKSFESFLKEQPDSKRARVMALPVSAPFHCSLMKPAEERLGAALEKVKISPNQVDYIPNESAQWMPSHSDPTKIKKALIRQVTSPVRWTETLKKCSERPLKIGLELGPGSVLSGLLKKQKELFSEEFSIFSLGDIDSFHEFERFLSRD